MAYIDKELFKQDIKMRYCNNCARPNEIKCRACHIDDMLGEIEDAPTVDVVKVKHGKWICNTDDFSPKIRCSVCGYNKPLVAGVGIEQEPNDYCNKCGAKMDGVRKEDV